MDINNSLVVAKEVHNMWWVEAISSWIDSEYDDFDSAMVYLHRDLLELLGDQLKECYNNYPF